MERDAYFEFLEALRKSGETNMYGAAQWLEGTEPEESGLHLADFNLEPLAHDEAISVLKEWMKNYSELSAKFGWDRSMTPEEGELPEEDNSEYLKLFDEDIDRDIIDNFLKVLADEEIMNELDGAQHIWYLEGLPFVVSYEDGKGNLISLVDGKATVYDKFLDEYCDDFGLDFEKAREKIKEKTGIDFKPEEVNWEDNDEVVEYGSDEVIEDDFEEGE